MQLHREFMHSHTRSEQTCKKVLISDKHQCVRYVGYKSQMLKCQKQQKN